MKSSHNNQKVYTSSNWTLNFKDFSVGNYGLVAESYALERLLGENQKHNYFREKNRELDFVNWHKKTGIEIKCKSQITVPEFKNFFKLCQEKKLTPIIYSLYPEKINEIYSKSVILI